MEKYIILPLLMTMILSGIFKSISGHPVSDEVQLYTSTQQQNSEVEYSMPIVSDIEISNKDNTTEKIIKTKRVISKHNLPPSPVGLLRPDTFQFYTFNQNGDVIMKQMSRKDIESLIASSGGGHIPIEMHEPEKTESVLSGETKVTDVIQNVQNVLKGELNKPPSVMTAMPTIPGHDNSEWSNILPSILASDMELDTMSDHSHDHDFDLSEGVVHYPISSSNPDTYSPIKSEMHDTKPMIPVALITVDKQPYNPPIHDHNEELNKTPIFHILNTFTAYENDSIKHKPDQLMNNFGKNQTADLSESNAIPNAVLSAITTTPCPSTSSICNDNSEISKKPGNMSQTTAESINNNKTVANSEANFISVIYSPVAEIPMNAFDKKQEEKTKLTMTTTTIETMYTSQKPIQLNIAEGKEEEFENTELSVNMNKEKVPDGFLTVTESLNNFQSQDGNTFSSSESNIGQSTTSKIVDKSETTTVNINTSMNIHQTTPQNEILSTKQNLSITPQIIVNNNSNQYHSQMNSSNYILNEASNISQSQEPVIIYLNNISSMPIESTSTEYLNTSYTDILEDNQQKSSTSSIAHTTLATTLYEESTSNTHIESSQKIIITNTSSILGYEPISHKYLNITTIPTSLTPKDSSSSTTTKSTEPMPTELANSLSSMISQISQMLPSILPTSDDIYKFENTTNKAGIIDGVSTQYIENYEKETENSNTTEKSGTNVDVMIGNYIPLKPTISGLNTATTIANELKINIDKNLESDKKDNDEKKEITETNSETPIVRIDIMETVSNVDTKMNITVENITNEKTDHDDDVNISNDNNTRTESQMVRIKLTDPLSALHQTLESSPVQSTVQNNIDMNFPTHKNLSANGIASGLIAGFNIDMNDTISSTLKYNDSITNSGTVFNERVENVNYVAQTSIASTDITVIPETTGSPLEFENSTHISLSDISTMSIESISALPSTTESIKSTVISICSDRNTSLEEGEHIVICPVNKIMPLNTNETDIHSNEKNLTESLEFTASSLEVTTESFIHNVTMKQETTTDTIIITEFPEIKIDETTDSVSSVINKMQSNDQLLISYEASTTIGTIEQQYTNEKISELTSLKVDNSSKHLEGNVEHVGQLNNSIKHTYSLENLTTSTYAPDVTINNSTIIPTKIKDKKKDDVTLESLNKISGNPTIPPKPNKPTELIEALSSSQKKMNLTQEKKNPEKWMLIPQKTHLNSQNTTEIKSSAEQKTTVVKHEPEKSPQANVLTTQKGTAGLDASIEKLDTDISYFSILCNDLAFTFWDAVNSDLNTSRSVALSPFGMTSMLAMIFLGARSPTSDRMNEILKLDDVTSFNPHLVFQNITDSIGIAENQGIANVAFIRELFADQSKVRKLMRFYKKQAEQFYDGMVEQVNFSTISDTVRRKTNFLIRKQTGGKIRNFVTTNTMPLRSPFAALSANIFQTDCSTDRVTSKGRDGELYFAVSPAMRQRKLVLMPAIVYKSGVLAGYEPSLDATAIAIGSGNDIVSTIFVIPGQQGFTAFDDNLDLLEQRLISGALHDGAWHKLLKAIVPRPELEVQIPKFSHKSIVNATAALKTMGLGELFVKYADFKGINGGGDDFHLSDVIQMNLFSTCGEENIQSGKTKHHIEIYPLSSQKNIRESSFNDELDNREIREKMFSSLKYIESNSSSHKISKVTRSEDKARVKLDKPFLYFVRHNPTGFIIFMGRFNPRLLS